MDSIRAQFDRDGFYVARWVYLPDELQSLSEEFDQIVSQILSSGEDVNARWSGPEMDRIGSAGTVVLHTHNVQQYSSIWLRALLHGGFLDVVEAILGSDIVLHHTKLFQKPAEQGAPFPMHQDWSYFPTEKDSMMAAIIHVSSATDEMGCLRVYPGSHKLGRIEDSHGQVVHDVLAKYPIEGATPLEAEAGDVVLFNYLTIHGSMPNRSNQIRKTVLVQMLAGDDAVEEPNAHPNERLALRGWNHRMTREIANRE